MSALDGAHNFPNSTGNDNIGGDKLFPPSDQLNSNKVATVFDVCDEGTPTTEYGTFKLAPKKRDPSVESQEAENAFTCCKFFALVTVFVY